ncbi:MAG: riboflavin synthase [Acidobacteria bacterium]|nr:riboflavin synthase [Acidobacteriota bacterium]
MFTGIIEEVGSIRELRVGSEGAAMTVACPRLAPAVRIGDSIAVNGVCLTATGVAPDRFTCDISAETLRRSALGRARAGARVNLERALEAGGRLGGHFVQGHVDDVGRFLARTPSGQGFEISFGYPADLARYLVYKGSIAVDGISLTLSGLRPGDFTVSVIPHTLNETTLGALGPGDAVNLEVDILGKYFERYFQLGLFGNAGGTGRITADYLKNQGF